METKICCICKREFPSDTDHFYSDRSKKDGLNSKCRECYSNWYLRNREKIIQRRRAAYIHHDKISFSQAHDGVKPCGHCKIEWPATRDHFGRNSSSPDGFDGTCRRCRRKKYHAERDKHLAAQRAYRAVAKDSVQKWRDRIRREMLDAYGRKCACCGESQEEFLQLDHIGGRTDTNHPWKAKAGTSIYGYLKKLGWPRDAYQLLCANCNWAVRYNRTCPHQRK